MAVHKISFRLGFRLPLHPFGVELFRRSFLAPAQLHPNGWAQLTGFFVLCHKRGVSPTVDLLISFYRFRLGQSRYHLYTLYRERVKDRLFEGIPPKAHNFDSRWFVVDPPSGTWYAPRGWRSDDRVAKSILPLSVYDLWEQYNDEHHQLLRGGPVSLLDLLSKDQLRRAGWVLHVGESSRCAAPLMLPLRPPVPLVTDVPVEGEAVTLQEWSEGLDLSNCPSPCLFLSA